MFSETTNADNFQIKFVNNIQQDQDNSLLKNDDSFMSFEDSPLDKNE